MNTSRIEYLVIELNDEEEDVLTSCEIIADYFVKQGFFSSIKPILISDMIRDNNLEDVAKCVVISDDTKDIIFECPYLPNPADHYILYTSIKEELLT